LGWQAHFDSESQAPTKLVRLVTLADEIENGEEEMRAEPSNVRAARPPPPHPPEGLPRGFNSVTFSRGFQTDRSAARAANEGEPRT
jgi:hypothetical protein